MIKNRRAEESGLTVKPGVEPGRSVGVRVGNSIQLANRCESGDAACRVLGGVLVFCRSSIACRPQSTSRQPQLMVPSHFVSGTASAASGTHMNEIDGGCPCWLLFGINAVSAALLQSAEVVQLPVFVTTGDPPPGTSTIM
jgi:hypothetical protein